MTELFHQRIGMESQSSANFHMEEIHSESCDDNREETSLFLRHVESSGGQESDSFTPRRRDSWEESSETQQLIDSNSTSKEDPIKESWIRISVEIFLPFIVAGFGCILAGFALSIVQVINLLVLICTEKRKIPNIIKKHDIILIF